MHFNKVNKFSDYIDLAKNPEMFGKTYKSYSEHIHARTLHIKEVGISGKLLNDWVEAGIVNKPEVIDNKWRLFSLSEAIWIKFVAELRYFGVTLPQIKIIKERACEFDKEFFKELSDAIKAVPNPKDNESLSYIKSKAIEIQHLSDDQQRRDYERFGISYFDLIMIHTLVFDLDVIFCFTKTVASFIDLSNKFGREVGLDVLEEFRKTMGRESFAVINMKSIYQEFFSNEKIDQSDDFYFGIVTQKEREILNYIRSGEYSSVSIKVEDGIIKLAKVTKKDVDKLMNKIGRLLKKGDFKEISFLSRDGRIVRYDEVDIIK
jgi:DNA-binding transcriptional MerR regulator